VVSVRCATTLAMCHKFHVRGFSNNITLAVTAVTASCFELRPTADLPSRSDSRSVKLVLSVGFFVGTAGVAWRALVQKLGSTVKRIPYRVSALLIRLKVKIFKNAGQCGIFKKGAGRKACLLHRGNYLSLLYHAN
jgi:hypothetical protein